MNSPFLKAIAPALLTVVAILIQVGVTGEFDRAELVTALTGFAASIVAYIAPNAPPA